MNSIFFIFLHKKRDTRQDGAQFRSHKKTKKNFRFLFLVHPSERGCNYVEGRSNGRKLSILLVFPFIIMNRRLDFINVHCYNHKYNEGAYNYGYK